MVGRKVFRGVLKHRSFQVFNKLRERRRHKVHRVDKSKSCKNVRLVSLFSLDHIDPHVFRKRNVLFFVVRNTVDVSVGVGKTLDEKVRVVSFEVVKENGNRVAFAKSKITLGVKRTSKLSGVMTVISDFPKTFLILKWFSACVAHGLCVVKFSRGVIKDHRNVVLEPIVNFPRRLFKLFAKDLCHVFITSFYVRHRVHLEAWYSRDDVKAKSGWYVSLVKFGLAFCAAHRFKDAFEICVNFNRTLDSVLVTFEFQNVLSRLGKNGVNTIMLRAK